MTRQLEGQNGRQSKRGELRRGHGERRKLSSVSDLVDAGLILESDIAALEPVGERYAVALSPTIVEAIRTERARGLADGPMARQFLPDAREGVTHAEEVADPIGDQLKSPVPGIVHRYPDRALLKLATACPVYCRFCFRREQVGPGQAAMLPADDLAGALAYIRNTPAIWEVILTGGDPLVLAPRHLRTVQAALSDIEHVKIVRWHTRVPVVAPELLTADLIAALVVPGKTTYLALHANHADEFTPEADAGLRALRDAGLVLVSQSVLLRGINDDVATLEALMRTFVERGITPYYLHHPDLAPGTRHFRLSIAEGQELMRALRGRLSGLAQPTYVLDMPGAFGKVPIGPNYVSQTDDGVAILATDGRVHAYPDLQEPDGDGWEGSAQPSPVQDI
ncbi:MAG: lysine-2,3-aminomutase-like protein [Pseudomonadota bacterium]